MGAVVRIQKELVRLLNLHDNNEFDNGGLREFIPFINSMSPFEIFSKGTSPRFALRNKKTLKEICLL